MAKVAKAAKKAKLDRDGLTTLGLERLIEIALDEAALNTSFKKRLNAALAGISGAAGVAKLIDSRLTALEKSSTRIRWQKERAFGNDLDSISASIVKEFGAVDPGMALERLIRFVFGYEGISRACQRFQRPHRRHLCPGLRGRRPSGAARTGRPAGAHPGSNLARPSGHGLSRHQDIARGPDRNCTIAGCAESLGRNVGCGDEDTGWHHPSAGHRLRAPRHCRCPR
ncbi:hypothetical protein LP421_14645 [Rhizobium sp. RCAM05350]|nr:hypothetical protein LP421_14645 [Rhizobium sp. RCAM05350]